MTTANAKYSAYPLGNGGYTVLLGPAGGGCSIFDGLAITRWAPDPTCDDGGLALFLRDLDTGEYEYVVPLPGSACARRAEAGVISNQWRSPGIEYCLDVAVAPCHAAELRRLTLSNVGDRVRRFDITSFAELALNTLAADAAHPGFSRLFVQTERVAEPAALLAWRRLRSPGDVPIFAVHALVGGTGAATCETDRARFVGRGRERFAPAALAAGVELGGTTGAVLDPIFAMRRGVVLQPGESASVTAVLAAAVTRAAALDIATAFADRAAIAAVFSADAGGAGRNGADAGRMLLDDGIGMPAAWHGSVVIEQARVAAGDVGAVPFAASGNESATRPHEGPALPAGAASAASLRFYNGVGGFTADGAEYAILLPRDANGELARPPLPWCNVLAGEAAGCIISESGATYTWAANSRENRITPWFNDPVRDPHGEALFIRDDATGEYWSPTPGPRPGRGGYEVRHGFGYTRFLHESAGLLQETVVFVPEGVPARVVRLRVTNPGTAPRRLSAWSYAQLVLGTHEADTRGLVETSLDAGSGAILAVQPQRGEFSDRVAFALAACHTEAAAAWTTDRREFIGCGRTIARPAAVAHGRLARFAGTGHDPCAALSLAFTIEPGATVTCAFVLGEADDGATARAVISSCADIAAVDAALGAARAAWADRVSAITIETPVPAIDVMVNGWLTYQNLVCRIWARSAYYQSGGAFGFRDQLQDSSALLYLDPALTRRQILLHAAHQFVEGDVLHWWHPPLGKGIRTRFSDDLLWLPYIAAFYIDRTGDDAILDERVRYIAARPLEPGEDEAFLVPEDAGTTGSLYEHCCRALDRSLTRGVHGLPLMGVGDWNDGMNRVGRAGRGESVWLGFFLYDILGDFVHLGEARGDATRVEVYRDFRVRLGQALNDGGWDGEWYRRAYYDNGAPLGSSGSDECRIDALAQSWAVISGAAPADRAASALDAMERHLVSEQDGIIRLLAPAFDRTQHDPGYIKGYLPGVRENGGQYTHGVLWSIRALAEHGRCNRAAHLLEMLSPVTHGGSPERIARYQVEPYVIAADIYGVAPHVGRGGWTWYTGSAGWMYRVAIESVLGVELHRGCELRLRPCIPPEWPGFRLRYRMPDGTAYSIAVERTSGPGDVAVDGGPPEGARQDALVIPLLRDGAEHRVHVRLGPDVLPRYAPR
jgi:N,N'-diacetylchitobiose phosphorylase